MHTLTVTGSIPDFSRPHRVSAFGAGVSAIAATSDGPDTDAADIAASVSGDRRAFERLYRKYCERIFALCLRMTGERAVAEELVQDVFVRAWQKLTLFRGDSAFGTWLHRVAVNVVLSHRQKSGVHKRRTVDDEQALDNAPARPVTVADRVDLESAIAELPEGARRIFVLHDVEGYTHDEIGSFLGISSGGSKAQLHRARMLLREALSK